MVSLDQQPEHTARLAERLAASRRRLFVGRAAEIDLFRTALLADEPSYVALYLYGPAALARPRCCANTRESPRSWASAVFGSSAWASSGKRVKPGEYTITMLEARTQQEVKEVRRLSLATVRDMLQMSGFIEWTGVIVGTRMYTITAWEHPGDSKQMMRSGTHLAASKRYYGAQLSTGGIMAWLRPERFLLNALCPACGRMLREPDTKQICECGHRFPETALPW